MHIPDGFVDLKTGVTTAVVSAAALAVAVKKSRETGDQKQVPLMGVMAAFIFAAQMVNFPVAGGTSGHLLGAALATYLLGPWSGMLVMSTVVIIQALFFQDGGVTALGSNLLNMAVLGSLVSYFIFRLLGNGKKVPVFVSALLAGAASVLVAATACSLELAFSGTVPLKVVLPAMLGWHVLIGTGEGLITGAILAYLTKTQMLPEITGSTVSMRR